ncbi:membrane-associated phosphatidylinositol transfer protein 3 [Ictalurus punctatus]|uniref:Membrane-associated phosphatidylinositol transfer protein 3 n=1 Tax=Ictalurus punctatus TaxID=7998 RepID=A0A2D0SVZ0_ICTPU|nr:membrane-associated phosphatidylinositol transfer protein 3 [Ictalurus punctatus]XP_017346484.1 membrane-associated phosphatidylinositol transfer protein 3 [Ictalurus punctatus]XP_053543472.1 membrane-associated phosphatidylinositol transfer protein 3 [Ictalurus punctatus]XP_053543473.1 membrane-associated phosphatidylinositol transfer protein 3 [Ictalurus punctatus]
MDSSDDEFYDARESLCHNGKHRCIPQSGIEGLEGSRTNCKTQVLILVVHGGNILDPASGDLGAKAADVATLSSVLGKVAQAHIEAATQKILIKLVPCPAVCAEAFSLVSNLNPYSHDQSCVSSSVDHLPLAALPLLAVASPHYQDSVASIISRANEVYRSFLQSPDGQGFTGQVCLLGDCVGGVLCFDALCFSNSPQNDSPSHRGRHNSMESLRDNPGLLGEDDCGLSSSKRLSKSNIEISCATDPTNSQHPFHSSQVQDGIDPRLGGSSPGWNPGHFDFEVSECFLLGCPLGLVLAMRRTVLPSVKVTQMQPACSQIYNLFYLSDPSASRLEPLLHSSFHQLPPVPVLRYHLYPLGDCSSTLIVDEIHSHPDVFLDGGPAPGGAAFSSCVDEAEMAMKQEVDDDSEPSGCRENKLSLTITNISSSWWGSKRLDYALYCPDILTAFPTVALPQLFHASYWESTDVVAFLLRVVMQCDSVKTQEADRLDPTCFSHSSLREKWLRRRTHVMLRNITANHRVNDVIVTEERPQTLVGRFMYGPLDMVTLTGEKVDVYVMTKPHSGCWVYFDTKITNSSGKVSYTIPDSKKFPVGVYPIKMVVRGDQTSAEAFLTVLPQGMECVVFSIDGSFAASVSIMGSDPKMRAGAVDVVRHWQDQGYLIIYITGRPDMQKQRVVSWLSQHNFPQGMIFFSEGLVHDPLRQKSIFLRNLIQECHVNISLAYGSMKDISVYTMLGLSRNQIYIVGRPSKKYENQCQFLSEGYAIHLSSLQFGHQFRSQKTASMRMMLRNSSFGLSTKPDFLPKRTLLRRTMSVQPAELPKTLIPKPERSQSQPEYDKEHKFGGGMFVLGGMHFGNTTP